MSAASLMLTELEVVDVLFSASLMLQCIVMLGLRIVAGDDATVHHPGLMPTPQVRSSSSSYRLACFVALLVCFQP